MRTRLAYAYLVGLLALGGCSAIIDVDTDKLGGGGATSSNGPGGDKDGGQGGLDTCDDGCQDGVACTADQCVDNLCVYRPNDGICLAGQRCDAKLGCVDNTCTSDKQCDDGQSCTVDKCDASQGCTHKGNAAACDDGIACTDDACTGGAGAGADGCVHKANNSRCTFCFGAAATCSVAQKGCVGSPRDCSDGNACTTDSCNAASSSCMSIDRDADSDGSPANSVGGTFCGGGDCDDANAAVFPGATELCDKVDNDCDGSVDEGCKKVPDTCDSATTLNLDASGRATISGMLSDYGNQYSTSCSTQGLDAVYKIPVTKASDIIIDTGTSAARISLAASSTCDTTSFSASCAGAISAATKRSRLMVHNFDPSLRGNALYLLVEGFSATESAAFSISVLVRAVTPDTCSAPFDLGEGGTVVGLFSSATGQIRGSCQTGPGSTGQSEAVFKAAAPADGSLALTATSPQISALYVRSVCDSSDTNNELVCVTPGGLPGGQRQATATVNANPGAALSIFIDGGRAGSSYSLKFEP